VGKGARSKIRPDKLQGRGKKGKMPLFIHGRCIGHTNRRAGERITWEMVVHFERERKKELPNIPKKGGCGAQSIFRKKKKQTKMRDQGNAVCVQKKGHIEAEDKPKR